MLFGRRKKNQADERVLNLKARVDALRQADEASRVREKAPPSSLDQFLEGDDVLTGREVDDTYVPDPGTSESASANDTPEDGDEHVSYDQEGYDVDLEAELQKYLQRQEAQGQNETPAAEPLKSPWVEDNASWSDGGWGRHDFAPPRGAGTGPEPSQPDGRPLWLTPFPQEPASPERASSWHAAPESELPESEDGPAENQWPPQQAV